MSIRTILASCVLLLAASLQAQTASLTPASPAVAGGAVLTFDATAAYAGTPTAAGWIVVLPEGWTFVATEGPDRPQVGPKAGTSGTLEWAYTTAPANSARFSFKVKVPAKAGAVQLTGKLLLRADGRQQTVELAPASVVVAH